MIVITGAAGFIGSNLAHRLAELQWDEIVLVDRDLTAAKAANLAGLLSFRFLGHEKFLQELEEERIDPRVIFHLGACSDTTETDWEFLRRNNLEYTRQLWIWCARRGRPFIYASSAATYGDGSHGFSDRTAPAGLEPLNLYGRSKNDFDIWALEQEAAGEPTPLGWAGLKFFNVFGSREGHKGRMASVVLHAWNQIRETGRMRLFESDREDMAHGDQRRDFVYVGDCVDHMLWLWEYGQARGLFNSGTGKARTFNDLVRATFKAMALEEAIDYFPMPEDLRGKYQSFTEAEMGTLQECGYSKEPTSLEDGVAAYVEWLTGGLK